MKLVSSLCRALSRAALRRCAAHRPMVSEAPRAPALIVAPHQDDETLACGGMIALKRSVGARVDIVFFTDGSASHPDCPDVKRDELALIRRAEAVRAAAVLGVSRDRLHFMDLPDGELATLGAGRFDEAASRLSEIIRNIRPREVFTPHPHDCWPDHEAGCEMTRAALASAGINALLLFYPVWLWHSLPLRRFRAALMHLAFRLDISSVLPKKLEAIRQYSSQLTPICGRPNCGCLPAGFLKHFRHPYETFFRGGGTGS